MIFLLITILISTLIKYTNIKPFSFLLIISGIILGLIYNYSDEENDYHKSVTFWVNMHPHNFLFIFLPPLIYESSFLIDFHIFKKTFKIILSLAILGVIGIFLLCSLFFYLFDSDFNNKYSLILGSILSATDPIAVIAILNELKISERLSIIIEGESLLNDGITIVLFNIVTKIIFEDPQGEKMTIDIFRLLFGGLLVGFIFTALKVQWLKKTYNDVTSEIIISLGVCYLIYYIAEFTDLHTSGILALVVSGLYMGAYGKTRISPASQDTIKHFWSLLSSISNMVIFTLSGIIIATKISFSELTYINWILLPSLYIFVNLTRLLASSLIYPMLKNHNYNYDEIDFSIIVLSGLRGEISLALALFINLKDEVPIKIKNLILFYTSGVVFLSILINSKIINEIITKFQKNKILINTRNMDMINKTLNRKANIYLEELKDVDFHLEKADFSYITDNLIYHIDNDEIIIDSEDYKPIDIKLFISTIKNTIWGLFDENLIHYDIVIKLIDVIDISEDNHEITWGIYMKNFCKKNIINGYDIEFFTMLENNCNCFSPLKKYIVYHKIEYIYNFLTAYVLTHKKTLKKLEDILEENSINNYIELVEKLLEDALLYLKKLEDTFDEFLIEIETKNLSIIVINKQKRYLNHLFKNGEIDDKTQDILLNKLNTKEYELHQHYFLR